MQQINNSLSKSSATVSSGAGIVKTQTTEDSSDHTNAQQKPKVNISDITRSSDSAMRKREEVKQLVMNQKMEDGASSN